MASFVSGHDFSRAARATKSRWALAPDGTRLFSPTLAPWRAFSVPQLHGPIQIVKEEAGVVRAVYGKLEAERLLRLARAIDRHAMLRRCIQSVNF
jgi:hypothetical protein